MEPRRIILLSIVAGAVVGFAVTAIYLAFR
jgi:hypothetical protein